MITIKKKGKNGNTKTIEVRQTIGKNLSFSASEAYKLLRTNILFSIASEKKCKTVGITSALAGEGKSTTAINLAYTIAEADKKVLLLECDMRRPSIAKKLELRGTPGLSNVLAGLSTIEEVTQSALLNDLYIITAGDIPPNPSELLDSEAMKHTLEQLKEIYDFIIFDLPPVTLVSDALIVSKLVDGIGLVVRQNYNSRQALSDAVNLFKFTEGKLLGFIMTGSENAKKSYYKKYSKKYNYYRKSYGHGYGYGYCQKKDSTIFNKDSDKKAGK